MLKTPTMVVFDLDPGLPADIVQCCQVAFWLKEKLEKLGLQSFPKTSGSKGLQIYIPLNTKTSYDMTKMFAKNMAELLEREHPEEVVSKMAKVLAQGESVRGLEPERRSQDDRLRLFAAREGAADCFDAGDVG